MTHVDGKKIAAHIYETLKDDIATLERAPTLGIVTCAPTFETEKYLSLKERKAKDVGIETLVVRLPFESTSEDIVLALKDLVQKTEGVVVQLPLPAHIDVARVLISIPPSHDVDALSPDSVGVLSPVVGAIAEILRVHEVPVFERHVVVIGSGKLVGLPASRWFMEHGASVSVVTNDTADIEYYTRNADIIVSGAGVPNLVTPDMVKEGVVILDAGTSEDGGILVGDVDLRVAEKASLFTPVPGGIGPITIAILLRNLTELSKG